MGALDYVLLGLIAALVVFAIRRLVRRKGCGCGCGGDCAACAHRCAGCAGQFPDSVKPTGGAARQSRGDTINGRNKS